MSRRINDFYSNVSIPLNDDWKEWSPMHRSLLSRLVVLLLVTLGAALTLIAQEDSHPKRPQKRIIGDYTYYSKFNTPPYAAAQIRSDSATK